MWVLVESNTLYTFHANALDERLSCSAYISFVVLHRRTPLSDVIVYSKLPKYDPIQSLRKVQCAFKRSLWNNIEPRGRRDGNEARDVVANLSKKIFGEVDGLASPKRYIAL